MTKMKTRTPDWQEHWFPCDCGDWHFLQVSIDKDEPQWRWLVLADAYIARRWRDRLKGIWMLVRGKEHSHRGVILNQENVTDLKSVIDALLEIPSFQTEEA